jgi:hypothetical protein
MSKFDPLNPGDLIEPYASAGEHMAFEVVGDAEIVVLVAHEYCCSLFDGNVALIRLALEVVDQDPLC